MIKSALLPAVALSLAGCGHMGQLPPPEPVVRTVTVKVPTAIPCPALAQLGGEPSYPDTDAALRAVASNLADALTLLGVGRLLRIQRLAEYEAAKTGCSF